MVVLNCDLVLKSVSQKGGGVRGSGKARDQSPGTLLRKLTHLNLPEKGIDHIGSDLSVCGGVSVMYLYDNEIPSICNLDFAVNLTHLYLQNNHIQRIEGLTNCTNLQKLYLSGNSIVVVEGLHTVVSLRELSVDQQRLPPGEKLIWDPRSLVNICRSLEVMNVSGNRIDSVKELRCMSRMRQLNLSNNKLKDMKDLADTIGVMGDLTKLDVHGNPLVNKAKYRDRVITMNENIKVLDGKEVAESLKQFLRSWKSAKEKHKRQLIDQAMTDTLPDLPPLQKVPNSNMAVNNPNAPHPRMENGGQRIGGKDNNFSASTVQSREGGEGVKSGGRGVAPPIKRGMHSGQREMRDILAKSAQQQQQNEQSIHQDYSNGHSYDYNSNGHTMDAVGAMGDEGGLQTGVETATRTQAHASQNGANNVINEGGDDMPLLALTDPQASSDSNWRGGANRSNRQHSPTVLDIQVRTPPPAAHMSGVGGKRPPSGGGTASRRQHSGAPTQVVPLKPQVMDFGSLSATGSGVNNNNNNSSSINQSSMQQLPPGAFPPGASNRFYSGHQRPSSGANMRSAAESSRSSVFDKDQVKLNL